MHQSAEPNTAIKPAVNPTVNPTVWDLIILGGGLAGLTLALQLRQRMPDLKVLVLERRLHPVPAAAHKVGESSVEIGAHYFENVLGLRQHLLDAQLKKFGFRFFFSEGRRDIDQVTELGASRPLPVGSWQIDRGVFENFLAEEAQRRGVHFIDGAMVRELRLADPGRPGNAPTDSPTQANANNHQVDWQQELDGQPRNHSASAPWVIDASGRVGLIKKKLNLSKDNNHAAHAVWFRISEHIKLDDWSSDLAWQTRCETPTRWLSTNHLVGAGYWVWLIPLSSGSHSVGIVADPRYHALERMNSFERAMDWLREYQPRLFDALDNTRHKLQDFAFFRRFSYDCKQVFSEQRWALTGEAGRFLDPFYSPGSDFIAMGNTYITELVARERQGQSISAMSRIYEQIFQGFYDNTLSLYVDQYGLFGDPEVLPLKIFWDYSYYWGVLAQLFFQNATTDLMALQHLRNDLASLQPLNHAMQKFLRQMGEVSRKRNVPLMLDQASLPWFAALNGSMLDMLDRAALRQRLQQSALLMRQLATQIMARALADYPQLDSTALAQAIDAAGGPVLGGDALLFARLPEEALAV